MASKQSTPRISKARANKANSIATGSSRKNGKHFVSKIPKKICQKNTDTNALTKKVHQLPKNINIIEILSDTSSESDSFEDSEQTSVSITNIDTSISKQLIEEKKFSERIINVDSIASKSPQRDEQSSDTMYNDDTSVQLLDFAAELDKEPPSKKDAKNESDGLLEKYLSEKHQKHAKKITPDKNSSVKERRKKRQEKAKQSVQEKETKKRRAQTKSPRAQSKRKTSNQISSDKFPKKTGQLECLLSKSKHMKQYLLATDKNKLSWSVESEMNMETCFVNDESGIDDKSNISNNDENTPIETVNDWSDQPNKSNKSLSPRECGDTSSDQGFCEYMMESNVWNQSQDQKWSRNSSLGNASHFEQTGESNESTSQPKIHEDLDQDRNTLNDVDNTNEFDCNSWTFHTTESSKMASSSGNNNTEEAPKSCVKEGTQKIHSLMNSQKNGNDNGKKSHIEEISNSGWHDSHRFSWRKMLPTPNKNTHTEPVKNDHVLDIIGEDKRKSDVTSCCQIDDISISGIRAVEENCKEGSKTCDNDMELNTLHHSSMSHHSPTSCSKQEIDHVGCRNSQMNKWNGDQARSLSQKQETTNSFSSSSTGLTSVNNSNYREHNSLAENSWESSADMKWSVGGWSRAINPSTEKLVRHNKSGISEMNKVNSSNETEHDNQKDRVVVYDKVNPIDANLSSSIEDCQNLIDMKNGSEWSSAESYEKGPTHFDKDKTSDALQQSSIPQYSSLSHNPQDSDVLGWRNRHVIKWNRKKAISPSEIQTTKENKISSKSHEFEPFKNEKGPENKNELGGASNPLWNGLKETPSSGAERISSDFREATINISSRSEEIGPPTKTTLLNQKNNENEWEISADMKWYKKSSKENLAPNENGNIEVLEQKIPCDDAERYCNDVHKHEVQEIKWRKREALFHEVQKIIDDKTYQELKNQADSNKDEESYQLFCDDSDYEKQESDKTETSCNNIPVKKKFDYQPIIDCVFKNEIKVLEESIHSHSELSASSLISQPNASLKDLCSDDNSIISQPFVSDENNVDKNSAFTEQPIFHSESNELRSKSIIVPTSNAEKEEIDNEVQSLYSQPEDHREQQCSTNNENNNNSIARTKLLQSKNNVEEKDGSKCFKLHLSSVSNNCKSNIEEESILEDGEIPTMWVASEDDCHAIRVPKSDYLEVPTTGTNENNCSYNGHDMGAKIEKNTSTKIQLSSDKNDISECVERKPFELEKNENKNETNSKNDKENDKENSINSDDDDNEERNNENKNGDRGDEKNENDDDASHYFSLYNRCTIS